MMYLDKALQFASIGLLVYLPINAYAYLDPGTFRMLLSVLHGFTSSAAFMGSKVQSMLRSVFFKLMVIKDDLRNHYF